MAYGGGGGTASAGRGTGGRGVGSDIGRGYAGGGPTGGSRGDYGGASSATGGVGRGFGGNPGGYGGGGYAGGGPTGGRGSDYGGGMARGGTSDFAGNFGEIMGALFGGGGGSVGMGRAGHPENAMLGERGSSTMGKNSPARGAFAGTSPTGQSTRSKDAQSNVNANIEQHGHQGFKVGPAGNRSVSGRLAAGDARAQPARSKVGFDTGTRPTSRVSAAGAATAGPGPGLGHPENSMIGNDPRAAVADVMDAVFGRLAQMNDFYASQRGVQERRGREAGEGGLRRRQDLNDHRGR